MPFSAVSLHIHIAGSYLVLLCILMVDLLWCVSSCESWHVFVLSDSVLQGSLNNHCSNTLDTSGVQINIKKNLLPVLVLSSIENLQKVKLKEFC